MSTTTDICCQISSPPIHSPQITSVVMMNVLCTQLLYLAMCNDVDYGIVGRGRSVRVRVSFGFAENGDGYRKI